MNAPKRLKVMTVVGTRPEVIKLSRVMAALERQVDHVLVHTGQNYDHQLNGIFFEELGLTRPHHVLGVGGQAVAQVIADVIVKCDAVLELERPDALLLYGDTNSCLCVIPAKRRQIPVFHMEAGNRCFDARVPEELNRKVVDHLSRRQHAAHRARPPLPARRGAAPRDGHQDRLDDARGARSLRPRHRPLRGAGGPRAPPRRYLVVSTHREENVDRPERLRAILATLRALAERFHLPVVVSTHPRTRARLEQLDGGTQGLEEAGVRFLAPFGFLDYVRLQQEAFCVVSDSGTVTEESALVGFPAVTLRDAHERPEGMDAGTLVMSGLGAGRVIQAVEAVTGRTGVRPGVPPDYLEPHVSGKVLQIILSYVDYVNRTVWGRSPPLP